jgi:F-type H+-transporting ATPase subunit gamma
MANIRDIRRRIRSVKSTLQITKALKMVAAAKMRRAQEAIFGARPYAKKMHEVLASLASRVSPRAHPLLAQREEKTVVLLLMTSDRGLCGGFNSTLCRELQRLIAEKKAAGAEVILHFAGRKGRDFFKRRGQPGTDHQGLTGKVQFSAVSELSRSLAAAFTKKEIDAVYVVYNEFKSVIQQKVTVEPLLPLTRAVFDDANPPVDYVYEPEAESLIAAMVPKHLDIQLYRMALESAASEQGARMTAMDSASRNAGELISSLTLYANRVRQAAITKEIIEIVSGAAALAG